MVRIIKLKAKRRYEILWLRLAVYILDGRNFNRSRVTSRRDNSGLMYAAEHIEAAILRIESGYKNCGSYEY